MLMEIAKSGASGKPINLDELGITNMDQVIDNMNENEKILEDMQKPWEQKVAEAKATDSEASTAAAEETKSETQGDISNSSLDLGKSMNTTVDTSMGSAAAAAAASAEAQSTSMIVTGSD